MKSIEYSQITPKETSYLKRGMLELIKARKKQKNNRTPETDGIPAEFYKTFQQPLDDILIQVFNDAIMEAEIPQSWNETIIILIPKQDSDPTEIKNYRPISLRNVIINYSHQL